LVIFQKRVPGLTEAVLARFVAQAGRACGLQGSVNVLVTSGRELRSLNRRFRGLDHPTDVLSFPPILTASGFAGDIAVAADIAGQNARRLGHSITAEIKTLVLHGILHLAGHDHERDRGKMARKEQMLRKKLKLPLGLIERAGKKQ
jgi:probable rRNA maturation factor